MYIDEEGETLVEVLSVSVVFDDETVDLRMANIEGTFQVLDRIDKPVECYKRVEGSPSVLADGTLPLTGPCRCLLGPDWLFKLHLKETTRNLEICNGKYDRGVSCPDWLFNQPLSVFVPGKDGYALVTYMIFKRATVATIELWIDADACQVNEIHGSIWAKYDGICDYNDPCNEKHGKVTLFNVSEDKPFILKDGRNKFPLLRSTVAVPVGSDLVIESDLFQGSYDLLRDDPATFEAKVSGMISDTAAGVTVKISWDVDPFRAVGLKHPWPLTDEQ